jgi:hypothetical protein
MYAIRSVVTLLVGLVLFQAGGASAWDIEWIDQFGTPASDDVFSVAADPSGVYVGGLTGGALPGQSSAGATDAFLRKYDFSGAVLWTRQFGTPSFDSVGLGGSVTTDATGVYVGGRTGGTLPGQVSAGGSDAYVRKYSSAGDIVWTHQFGTAAFDIVHGTAIHSSGLYVAGSTAGTFPGEPEGSGRDTFVAKLNPFTGDLLWVRQFGLRGLPFVLPSGIAVDDTGVYVLGQQFTGDITVPPSHLRRYDFDGNLLWTREIPPTSNGCTAHLWGVAVHSTGVFAVGQADDGFFADAGCQGTINSTNHFQAGVGFLRKYDTNGDVLWTREIKGSPKEAHGLGFFTGAKRVRVSAAGVFVSANIYKDFAGQPSGGSAPDTVGCPHVDPDFFDQWDAYVRKYDFNGNVIWTHQFGSGRFDIAYDVAMAGDSLYAAGYTQCRIDPSRTFLGADDAYVLRMTVNPTSLPGQVQLIVGRLETLSDAGLLAPGDFNSLVKHLEAALGALDQGRDRVAEQNLEAFIAEVGTLESRGALSSSEAAALVAAANAVIAQL